MGPRSWRGEKRGCFKGSRILRLSRICDREGGKTYCHARSIRMPTCHPRSTAGEAAQSLQRHAPSSHACSRLLRTRETLAQAPTHLPSPMSFQAAPCHLSIARKWCWAKARQIELVTHNQALTSPERLNFSSSEHHRSMRPTTRNIHYSLEPGHRKRFAVFASPSIHSQLSVFVAGAKSPNPSPVIHSRCMPGKEIHDLS